MNIEMLSVDDNEPPYDRPCLVRLDDGRFGGYAVAKYVNGNKGSVVNMSNYQRDDWEPLNVIGREGVDCFLTYDVSHFGLLPED